jgi:hypothetical protein
MKMFDDRDVLEAYRLLEFPNETAQSWPIAEGERDEFPIRLPSLARGAAMRGGPLAE